LFAYGPADATAIPKPDHLLPHLNPDWFCPANLAISVYFTTLLYISGTLLPSRVVLKHMKKFSFQAVLEKRLLNGCSLVVAVVPSVL